MEEAPLIDEIWIITENGITLYNYRFIDEITEDLFGGFISAINAFASEIGMIDVRLIKGKKAQLVLTHDKQNKLTFVCKIQLDQEEMNAIQYLKELKKFSRIWKFGEQLCLLIKPANTALLWLQKLIFRKLP